MAKKLEEAEASAKVKPKTKTKGKKLVIVESQILSLFVLTEIKN